MFEKTYFLSFIILYLTWHVYTEASNQFTMEYTNNSTTMINESIISTITNISVTYVYIVQSNSSLKLGIINDTIVKISVLELVENSFNLSDFDIFVTGIQILPQTKIDSYKYVYHMLVDILFISARNDCDITCIYNSKMIQADNFTLPLENGTLVIVFSTSGPLIITETTTTVIVKVSTGEPPPGLAAKLGMGLGISMIGILIIAEIIFLHRKYGSTSTPRWEQYELP